MTALYQACWQIGDGKPTDYETRLGDALEAAFAAGHRELASVVAALNAAGVTTADGSAWTEAQFEREMQRLGG
ncbi:MAG: hypothetical protein KIT16_07670 [Rhodospirillaceae bacterium]|nr:hypothetical protein [Rhodospirillaceae bacterium]